MQPPMRLLTMNGFAVGLFVVLVLAVDGGEGARRQRRVVAQNDKVGHVSERGLLSTSISSTTALKELVRAYDDHSPSFPNAVLAYVTPWNNKGYDVAKTFNSKWTYVSPVWYNLKVIGKTYKLTGDHDVDAKWIEEVRRVDSDDDNVEESGSEPPLIVPRVLIDGWTADDFKVFFSSRAAMEKVTAMLVAEFKKQRFDGMVLDAGGLGVRSFPEGTFFFVVALANALHDEGMKYIHVIPPIRYVKAGEKAPLAAFTGSDLVQYAPFVDHFSLMTYDASNAYNPGYNAPLPWVLDAALAVLKETSDVGAPVHYHLAHKILLGLQFYGNDFVLPRGGGPIIGPQYLDLLRTRKPKLEWDASAHEHVFTYRKGAEEHAVYYPTPQFLHDRLELARSLGMGISIWEIGQGLDAFMDLF